MNRKTVFRKFPEMRKTRLVLRQATMKNDEWYSEFFSRPEFV